MVDFSGHSSIKPARFEVDLQDCEVTGTIPRDLDGGFYRMHLDWLYPPSHADDTILAADGYISLFRIKNGRADYKGRYVRTERYLNQIKAGRQLYGYYRNPFTDDPSVRDIAHPARRTTSNTTPVVLAGKLYSTKEDGMPYEIDPNTLETRTQPAFGGLWKSETFTAHPKIDPATGEMFAYGYEATGLCSRDVFVYCLDRNGKVMREWRFEAPHASVLHDMWLTSEHVVIPGGGLTTDIERIESGGIHWKWDRAKRSYHAVIPRNGESKDIRFFYGPERSIVHTANARTDGNEIVLDAPVAEGNTWPWFPDVTNAPYRPVPTTLRRLVLDLSSNDGRVREEQLFDTPTTSFTRIDERYTTRRYQHIYVQYRDTRVDSGKLLGRTDGNCFGKFNVATGKKSTFFPGPGRALSEPVFIPRSPAAPEGDGYIIGVGQNVEDAKTELYIVDAPTMEEAARVTLPFRTSGQVHGTWASANELPLT